MYSYTFGCNTVGDIWILFNSRRQQSYNLTLKQICFLGLCGVVIIYLGSLPFQGIYNGLYAQYKELFMSLLT